MHGSMAGQFGLLSEVIKAQHLCCSRTKLAQLVRRGSKFPLHGHFRNFAQNPFVAQVGGTPWNKRSAGIWVFAGSEPQGEAAPAGGFSQKSDLPPCLLLVSLCLSLDSRRPKRGPTGFTHQGEALPKVRQGHFLPTDQLATN